MMVASIETEPEFKVTGTEPLFEVKSLPSSSDKTRYYDVSADGQQFLMVEEIKEGSAANRLIVEFNWFEELKRRMTTGND